jgi:hypothetical protein
MDGNVVKRYQRTKNRLKRIVEIERPAGFTDIPTELFLTGTATEGGDDLTKAVKFKQTAPGKFEIYTSLKAGSIPFCGSHNRYTFNLFV